jgi:hypothetical protein
VQTFLEPNGLALSFPQVSSPLPAWPPAAALPHFHRKPSSPTKETQQGDSRAAAAVDEILPAEAGIFSGDAFTPSTTPPEFGIFSGPSFTAEPLLSPSRAAPRDPLESDPMYSTPQDVVERVLFSERAVSGAADLPSEGSVMDAMFVLREGDGGVALAGAQEPVVLASGAGADLPSEGSLYRAMGGESEGPDRVAVGAEPELADLLARAETLVDELLQIGSSQTLSETWPSFIDLHVLGQSFPLVVRRLLLTQCISSTFVSLVRVQTSDFMF